jgi:hypothetical protein
MQEARSKHLTCALAVAHCMYRCCEQALAQPGVRQKDQLGAADPQLVSGSSGGADNGMHAWTSSQQSLGSGSVNWQLTDTLGAWCYCVAN